MQAQKRQKGIGFTLIELLIVVAIIAILAAIAVPNFLEAQVRSKVARVKSDLRSMNTGFAAYMVDTNDIPPDANDGGPWSGTDWYTDNPGGKPDYVWDPGVSNLAEFYRFIFFSPLTTPIAYMTSIPHDAFSRRMPFGYDTRCINTVRQGWVAYAVVSSCGPDQIAGQWHRDTNVPKMALPYDPTNGTKSRGDIWRGVGVRDESLFKKEYPFEFN